MTEEEIFLAALELPSDSDRAAFLDEACGDSAALRAQVESLLAAHFKPGPFLDEPAMNQLDASWVEPVTATHQIAADDEPINLSFLQSSTRADALGRLGHYEVLEVLGQGGFGIVLRAFDDILQRVVALKVLMPVLAATSPARKRFLREARSSAQVRHEHVVQVYAVEEQPLPYLAMEFIPGETLQQRIDRTGPLELSEIVRFGRQIAEGLAAAHETGLIHRDIKPHNVLIEARGDRVKLTDFGLARAADDASLTQSHILAGTPMYMAPEQAQGETLDHRADLFSLGSVLYVMTTGRPPFRASTTYAVLKRLVEDDPRPIRDVIPETPQWLCDIIAKLQRKRPDVRFQSAGELADVLRDYEERLKTNPSFKQQKRRPSLAQRAGQWTIAAAVLLPTVVSLIAGITDWFSKSNGKLSETTKVAASLAEPGQMPFPASQTNSLGMTLRLAPAGKFVMGSSPAEIEHNASSLTDEVLKQMIQAEGPAHEVEISQPFYIGATEVTVAQFRKFVEANPSYSVGDDRWKQPQYAEPDDRPVVFITWQNADDFCRWLSEKEGKTYRLPTEAEWEYACRAGREGLRFSYGNDEAEFDVHAWSKRNSDHKSHSVGQTRPNAWGLFDMHGNVFEFCRDWHAMDYYQRAARKDPAGPAGSMRVTRGGSWNFTPLFGRSAFRSWLSPKECRDCIGFRVVLETSGLK